MILKKQLKKTIAHMGLTNKVNLQNHPYSSKDFFSALRQSTRVVLLYRITYNM